MSAFFKKYFILILPVVTLVALFVFHQEPKLSDGTLTIGLQSGYPPFEFRNADGKIVGFDLDLGERIASKLGKVLVVKDMEFEGEILSLKQGKIDLILSGMNITPSRLKEITMVPYHGNQATSLSLIFWKEVPPGIHSIEDIAKLPKPVVSVQSGAVSDAYLSRYPSIIAKSFEGALAPLMDVKFGKSMANLVESDVAEYLMKKHPEIKVLDVPLSKEDAILGFGIGIKKENKDLELKVSKIIHELKDSGELKQLADKWFKGGNDE